ncbi:MAG: hypothetical protein ACFS24_01400 [Candidatus Karelsulcia muelleri]
MKIKCKSIGALGGGISGSGPSVFMLSKGKKKAELVSNVMENIYSKLELKYILLLLKKLELYIMN